MEQAQCNQNVVQERDHSGYREAILKPNRNVDENSQERPKDSPPGVAAKLSADARSHRVVAADLHIGPSSAQSLLYVIRAGDPFANRHANQDLVLFSVGLNADVG